MTIGQNSKKALEALSQANRPVKVCIQNCDW